MFNNFNINMVDYKIAVHFKFWATKSDIPLIVKTIDEWITVRNLDAESPPIFSLISEHYIVSWEYKIKRTASGTVFHVSLS